MVVPRLPIPRRVEKGAFWTHVPLGLQPFTTPPPLLPCDDLVVGLTTCRGSRPRDKTPRLRGPERAQDRVLIEGRYSGPCSPQEAQKAAEKLARKVAVIDATSTGLSPADQPEELHVQSTHTDRRQSHHLTRHQLRRRRPPAAGLRQIGQEAVVEMIAELCSSPLRAN